MRRLWSHIILAATSLLMVGVTFSAVFRKASNNSNMEFTATPGRELVFRINGKNDEDKSIDKEYVFNNDEAVKEIASEMEKRLQTANVTRYQIETQGFDTLKVTFFRDSEQEYRYLENYLTFDATLALSNSKDTVAYAEEFLTTGKKAYLETSKGYPTVVVPIDAENEAFKAVYEEAVKMADDGEGEVVEEHEDDETETGEHSHETHALLYLWYNYVKDYYSYEKIDSNKKGTDEYDEDMASKILMTFDSKTAYDKNISALRAYIQPNDSSDGVVNADSLRKAYQDARYYVNLLNAGELKYYVTYLFYNDASVWVENPVNLGEIETLAWSRTLIATICAVVVVSLLLVYFYRLGALSIITSSIVSTFFGLVFIVTFGAEYNIAAIVGLIALAFTSLVSGIVYLNKFKEECYRGRTLKKANAEAAKRAALPTVDIHVALIAIGIACYLFGGALMKAFAVTSILGGLVSLLINLAGLRGLMWLVTNEQTLNGRYDLFDVSKEQIPNVLEEEKQKYYGPNADKDYTKNKKPIGFAALALLVASIAGMIAFGVANKGQVYGTTNPVGNSQAYIEYRSDTNDDYSLFITDTNAKLDTILENASLDGKKLSEGIVTYKSYEYTMRYETNGSAKPDKVYYAYYRLSFDRALKGDEVITYSGANTFETDVNDFFTLETFKDNSKCNINFDDNKYTLSLKNTLRVNHDQPTVTSLILATAIGAIITAFYLLLRYRLSRGLASLAISVITVGISAGIFAFLRFLPATSYVSVALPFIALFGFAVGIIYMNKEREMVIEDRSRDNSIENRNEIMKKAVAISSTPMTIAFIMALYLGVNFFGFMASSVSWIFLLVILGVSLAIALALTIYGPCAQLFFKLFSKVNIQRPQRKKKKARPARVNKSAEPEEAIFIGIND